MFLVVMASAGRVADTGPLTATALIVIAIFAVLVVIGILYGMRQKRIRAASEAEERQRAAELAAQDDTPAQPEPPKQVAPLPPPPPVEAVAKPATARAKAPTEPAAVKAVPARQAKPVANAAPPEPIVKAKAAPKPRTSATPAAKPSAPTEPQPVAATPAPTPAPAPEPSPAAAPASYALTDVKGLGPKAAGLLTGLGIADVAALAALDPARAAEVDGQLGTFAGRMTRDRWVEQAQLLAAGDIATFEATYGKL